MSDEPSFPPPLEVRPVRRAHDPTHTTSEQFPPLEVPLRGKAAPEPPPAEVPLPHRVREYHFYCSSLCSMVPSSHPGEHESGTAQQRHWGSETMQ